MEKLLKYLNGLEKDARTRFAVACGTTEGYMRKAICKRQLFSVPTCVAIERESGNEVTRKDLRPDDWAANWPEMVQPTAQEGMPQ
ncbi:MAG: Cro/Cl family transcriptional regulator [Pseudomonadota bacterium]